MDPETSKSLSRSNLNSSSTLKSNELNDSTKALVQDINQLMVRVQLPNNSTTAVVVSNQSTMQEVLDQICRKKELPPNNYEIFFDMSGVTQKAQLGRQLINFPKYDRLFMLPKTIGK